MKLSLHSTFSPKTNNTIKPRLNTYGKVTFVAELNPKKHSSIKSTVNTYSKNSFVPKLSTKTQCNIKPRVNTFGNATFAPKLNKKELKAFKKTNYSFLKRIGAFMCGIICIGGGMAIAVLTDGFWCILGGAFIGAGIKSVRFAFRNEEKLTLKNYLIDISFGTISGAATNGIAHAIASSVACLSQEISSTFVETNNLGECLFNEIRDYFYKFGTKIFLFRSITSN